MGKPVCPAGPAHCPVCVWLRKEADMYSVLHAQHPDIALDVVLDRFDTDRHLGARLIRQLAGSEPDVFLKFGLKMLREREFSPGLGCMGKTLINDERLPKRVVELIGQSQVGQSQEEVVGLVRKLIQCDPSFDVKILEVVQKPAAHATFDTTTIAKALDVLDAVSVNPRLLPLVLQLVQSPDSRIRSKATIFVGRRNRNLAWAQKQMLDADPRVRSNALESIYGLSSPIASQMMWTMVGDCNNRVAGTALLGLYQLGDCSVLPLVFQTAERSEAAFRTTAAWIMGTTGDARFAQSLAGLVVDPEATVRKAAFTARRNLKIALDKALARPALRLSVVASTQEDNRSSLTVVAQDSAGHQPRLISPTSWIVKEADSVVRDYSVETIECQGPLFIVFLTAETPQSQGTGFDTALEGMRHCVALREPGDHWAILKLQLVPREPAVTDRVQFNKAKVLQLETARDLTVDQAQIPVNFSRSVPDILGILAGDALKIPETAAEAIRQASCEVLARGVGKKEHLICIGPCGLDGLLRNDLLRHSEVSIHVITLPGEEHSEELRALTESTGGSFLVARNAESIPQSCEAVYASLRQRYRLSWRGNSNRGTVELYSEAGHGAALWQSFVDEGTELQLSAPNHICR